MGYFAHEFADDEEKFDSSSADISGFEKAGIGREFEDKARE
uniref:Uncharacterized protein n=1 Tax=Peronospora matthiolae TaxID=2874970 RepID=A0AAV1TXW9_9STRA